MSDSIDILKEHNINISKIIPEDNNLGKIFTDNITALFQAINFDDEAVIYVVNALKNQKIDDKNKIEIINSLCRIWESTSDLFYLYEMIYTLANRYVYSIDYDMFVSDVIYIRTSM